MENSLWMLYFLKHSLTLTIINDDIFHSKNIAQNLHDTVN
jgi:hypothetical protein